MEIGSIWVYRKRVQSELRRPREETAGAGNVLDTGRQKLGYEVAETLNLPLTDAYGRSGIINEMCCGSGNHTDVEVCEHLAPPAGVWGLAASCPQTQPQLHFSDSQPRRDLGHLSHLV